MEHQITLDKKDRIIEINGFTLIVHDDHKSDRRNVTCHSDKLQSYILSNKLTNENVKHCIIIGDLMHENTFDDIKAIEVKGYF